MNGHGASEWVNVYAAVLVMASFISILFYQLLTGVLPMPGRAVSARPLYSFCPRHHLCSIAPQSAGCDLRIGQWLGWLGVAAGACFSQSSGDRYGAFGLAFWVSRIRCRGRKMSLFVVRTFLGRASNAVAVGLLFDDGPNAQVECPLKPLLEKRGARRIFGPLV